MTRRASATSRDDHATSRRRDARADDQHRRASRDERDDRDEEFTRLTAARRAPRNVGTSRKGTRRTNAAPTPASQLLTVAEAAERLGTTERFPRRLIAERRITFVKLGSHVRIPETALDDFIAASTVEAVP
jgi:excisionase family DNA binding protein